MIKDISFNVQINGNGLTRIVIVNFFEILNNKNYLKQIFDVITVHYECLLIKNPFKNKDDLFNYLRNINSNVEFHFTFVKSKKNESSVLIIQK